MSDFYIYQHLLSSNCRTIVKNEQGKPLYLLVGRWGARGDVLSLYAMNGDIVARIKQTSFGFHSRFELYKGYEKVGTLQHLFSLNRDFYYIRHLRWAAIGDIQNHHYSIYELNHKIMDMTEACLLTGNYYVLKVMNDQNAPLCICIAAVLDYWLLNRKFKPETSLFKKPNFDWSVDYAVRKLIAEQQKLPKPHT